MADNKKHILLVEDSSMIRNLVISLLVQVDEPLISSAPHYDAAVEAITDTSSQPFDLIILDRYLPKDHGLELVELIRANYESVPIIMLTQEDQAAQIIEFINAGVSDYVIKPFVSSEFIEKVARLLKR